MEKDNSDTPPNPSSPFLQNPFSPFLQTHPQKTLWEKFSTRVIKCLHHIDLTYQTRSPTSNPQIKSLNCKQNCIQNLSMICKRDSSPPRQSYIHALLIQQKSFPCLALLWCQRNECSFQAPLSNLSIMEFHHNLPEIFLDNMATVGKKTLAKPQGSSDLSTFNF